MRGNVQDLVNEHLSLQTVRQREFAINQLRADVEARRKRSRQHEGDITRLNGEIDKLSSTLVRLSAEVDQSEREIILIEKNGREVVASSAKFFQDRQTALYELKHRMVQAQSKRLCDVGSCENDESGRELKNLWEGRTRTAELKSGVRMERRRAIAARADLGRALELVLRIHVDFAMRHDHNLLSNDFFDQVGLQVSESGKLEMQKLLFQYKDAIAKKLGMDASALADANWSQDSQSLDQTQSKSPRGRGEREASFEDEAVLLRQRLKAEMRKIAATLSEQGTIPEREALRMAAWGDQAAFEEFLPVLERIDVDMVDPDMHGWTPWHAAAAHGQADFIRVLGGHFGDAGPLCARSANTRVTTSGFSPLGVACILGHVNVVRALIEMSAPVDLRDARGNTAVFWATAAKHTEQALASLRLVLAAKGNPDAQNNNGQVIPASAKEIAMSQVRVMKRVPGTKYGEAVAGHLRLEDVVPNAARRPGQFHIIPPLQIEQKAPRGVLSRAANFVPPVRDSARFRQSEKARVQVKLSQEEEDIGVWSGEVAHYTHAGFANMFDAEEATRWPSHREASIQNLVLTFRRLLLFESQTWLVRQAIALADIQELITFDDSDNVLLLRLRGQPDILLGSLSHGWLVDELQLALARLRHQVARACSEHDREEVAVARTVGLSMMQLHDGASNSIGLLVFPVSDSFGTFLLLPHSPRSVLAACAESSSSRVVCGFIDLRRRMQPRVPGASVCWIWRAIFGVVCEIHSVEGQVSRHLELLGSPGAENPMFSLPLEFVRGNCAAEMHDQQHCFTIDYVMPPRRFPLEQLTFRASSARVRDTWLTAFRGTRAGTDH